ncbi:hypothetical protein LJC12_01210 [Odoribacter sp. OttesenSCG-928-J03]|nr:hypothetical protein [Odoribacter sp. OttesenSCG-928-J03]MDL2282948.1 hypothetical protein [Odoribacter sp. OttesenSCG-928-G04]
MKKFRKEDLLSYPTIISGIAIIMCIISFATRNNQGVDSPTANDIQFLEHRAATKSQVMVELSNRIAILEEVLKKNHGHHVESGDYFNSTEKVAPAMAKLSYKDTDGNTFLSGKEGYIWLGDYDMETDCWDDVCVNINLKNKMKNGELSVPAGREYRLTHNRVLRKHPASSSRSRQETIGVIPEGTLISLWNIENIGGDYWAQVRVEE